MYPQKQYAENPEGANNEEVLRKALLRVGTLLDISRSEMTQILGVSEATLSRFYNHKTVFDPQSKQGELALILIRLYQCLVDLLGDKPLLCQQWLRSHNDYFAQAPIEAIKHVDGLMNVVRYLEAMSAK